MTTNNTITFSVFTKPWKMELAALADFVATLGFDAIELPVRPGFQVEPENVTKGLPQAARIMSERGLKIASVAGPTDEPTIAACAESGVTVIRMMVRIGDGGYLATEADTRRQFDALVPLLDRHGVTVGVQNHCGGYVSNAMGLLHLIEGYDPKHIAAVWDAAHNALHGEPPELALDIVWSHLCMVNLKNAYWRRRTGPEAEDVQWEPYFTTGPQGLASWPRVAAELKRREWSGVVCLTAEYSDRDAVDRLIAQDIAFAKSLF